MKRIQIVLLALFTVFLCTGCFDVIEKYQINEDGTGKYIIDIDFSRTAGSFTSMIASMAEAENNVTAVRTKKEVVDSIIHFAGSVDSAADLSETEKKALRKGYARMFVDEPNNLFKVSLFYPYVNAEELGIIHNAMARQSYSGEGEAGLKMVLKEDKLGKFLTLSPNNSFVFKLGSDHVERKAGAIDTAWVSLDQQDSSQNEGNMLSMFADMYKFSMKTEIELPRPLKKIETTGITAISADRKKVSIIHMQVTSATLKPKDFAYRIEF